MADLQAEIDKLRKQVRLLSGYARLGEKLDATIRERDEARAENERWAKAYDGRLVVENAKLRAKLAAHEENEGDECPLCIEQERVKQLEAKLERRK